MKMYGDVPQEYQDLAEQLVEMEEFFDGREMEDGGLAVAKGYTCLAHDWYSMGMEEKGAILLSKAEDSCPGYFRGPIKDHVEQDLDYAYLVDRLQHQLKALVLMGIKSNGTVQ